MTDAEREHPADDAAAVTKNDAWLEAIGFDYDAESDDWHRCGLYLKWLVIGWRCQIEGRENLWATFGGEDVTRGDVRRLCSILRVSLKDEVLAGERGRE